MSSRRARRRPLTRQPLAKTNSPFAGIVNAADAMASLDTSQRKIVVRTAQNGDSAEIEIADNGPGIPVEKLNEVFEPFFTTKSDGMGMGLSIARTIIEAHGGEISAENRAGRGALFRIRLPLARSAADITVARGLVAQ